MPIGNYILLENGSSSVLDPVSVSTQVQELVLKDPFRNVKSLAEIKDGHKIASYGKTLISTNLLCPPSPSPGTDMVLKSCFEPQVEGTASIVWTETEDKMWRCQLAVKGRFFRTLQMTSQECLSNQVQQLFMYKNILFTFTFKCVIIGSWCEKWRGHVYISRDRKPS